MKEKKIEYCLKDVEVKKHFVLSLEKTPEGITLVIRNSGDGLDDNWSILSITTDGYLQLHGAIGEWTGLKLNKDGAIRCRPRRSFSGK